jgi:hypothetical protein
MDQSQLFALAKDLLLLISPLIARDTIQKLGESTADASAGLVGRAWSMLQGRFKSAEAQSALTVYPEVQSEIEDIRAELTRLQALLEQQDG